MVEITHEKHQYNAILAEGDTIAIYINGNPTEIEYTVPTGSEGIATFSYTENIK